MTSISVSNNGAGSYNIDGSSNPSVAMIRGTTYVLSINAPGHPFWIQTVSGGYSSNNIYNSGVTNNGTDDGVIIFIVPSDAPNTLYYACQLHSSMQGTILITDPVLPSPSLTNFSIPARTYLLGDTFTLTDPSSNSSEGAFSYSSDDTATASISGSTVSILKAGTVTITVTQAESTNYASGSTTATLLINKVTTSLTNFSIPARTYLLGDTFTLTDPSSNSSEGAFSYSSSNNTIASIYGSTVSILKAGTVTITVTQAESTNYASGSTTATLLINPATPSITNFSIPDQTYSRGVTFTLTNPSSNSSGAFSYSSSNNTIASISGSNVNILKAGTVTITATQAASTNYESGSITATLLINPPKPYYYMLSLFGNNSQVYYKPHSLSTGSGGSGVGNHRVKQRRT